MISERKLCLNPEGADVRFGLLGLEQGFEGSAGEFMRIFRAGVGKRHTKHPLS
jgi:hypothetical protein